MTDINITDDQFYNLIRQECASIAELLIRKNKQYGNSILRSPNVFSKTTPLDKIADRLDDKLSRVISGKEDDPEDAKLDIAGYLILERAVLRAMDGEEPREELEKPDTPETTAPEPVEEEKPKAKAKRKPAAKKATKKKAAPEVTVEVGALELDEAGAQVLADAVGQSIADELAAALPVAEAAPVEAEAPLAEDAPVEKTTEDDLLAADAGDLLGLAETEAEPVAAAEAKDDGLMGLL